ncbi:sorting nexin-11 [Myripristis murdjan]|uniref:PX domain-containing protein n=1 Tax=Myripristis murdjan TaxID=586833 RepID=A0A667X2C1_9TELE|nr:sorting nexin-11 [Myripristis murdjan]
MIRNHEEDEFIAVRVQDPRVQNEGSWNSYVDYKIFLHTNSKAFTAKTSCVRRRYSEFVWLKKKLQKNAGLVPVPDLPGKSLFSFSNVDFLERRRKGLQVFLDKVLHMTVCLSDSQLHLFLQTQLPVGHIQDCVQGHTPYTVTDAILTYASSNRGLAQAQEDDLIKEPSLTAVPYESMESPAPHLPSLQNKETSSTGLHSSSDADPLESIAELHDGDTELQLSHSGKSSLRVLQKNSHLEAVIEQYSPTEVSFFLGESQDDPAPEGPGLAEQTSQRGCQIQTPVEVHSPMGVGPEDSCGLELEGVIEEDCVETAERHMTLDIAKETDPRDQSVPHGDTQEKADLGETNLEALRCEPEVPEQRICSDRILEHVSSEEIGSGEKVLEHHAHSEEPVLEESCSEKPALQHHVISEAEAVENVSGSVEDHISEADCPDETRSSDGQMDPDSKQSDDPESTNEEALWSAISETHNVYSSSEVECDGDDTLQHVPPADQDQVKQDVHLVGANNKEDSDEDSQSLPSSNGSIAKVSDEEVLCDEKEETVHNANGYMKTSEEATHSESSSRGVSELQMNGCPVETESMSDVHNEETNRAMDTKDEDLPYMTDISTLTKSLESAGSAGSADLTENSDFNILESNCTAESSDRKCTDQVTLCSLSLDVSEDSHEGEVH